MSRWAHPAGLAVTLAATRTVTLAGALVFGVAQASPMDWLIRINRAAADLSFSGTFVYSHAGQIEAMQVVRRVKNDTMQERLYSLNGETREIVRDRNRIWCYIADQKVGVHDHRQTLDSGFPRIRHDDIERLMENYQFTKSGVNRVAGRMAQRINVIPNDGYRYGYHLWADRENGLLLRSDLVGSDNRVIEQHLFVAIDFDSEISDHALQAVTSKENLVWHGADIPQPSASLHVSNWKFNQLPAGYRLSKYIRRVLPMKGTEVEHLIFTDGLSTVSIFIKPASVAVAQSGMEGLSRMGAMHIYRNMVDDHYVTVMGEAPARTVKLLAAGVTYAR